MLQAMHGTLANDPKMEYPVGPDNREYTAAYVDILYTDGRRGSKPNRIMLLAWDEEAEHLAQYRKGDPIQFVGSLNAERDRKGNSRFSYTVRKIDDTRTLVAAAEKFLMDYEPPKELLIDQLARAEQQKDPRTVPQPDTQNKDIV